MSRHHSFKLFFSDANVFTIDGYQGKEKEVIIISLTRCNRNYQLGLFEDKRRMNVAITRAKRLCVIIGDSVTYKHDEDYEVLFKESLKNLRTVIRIKKKIGAFISYQFSRREFKIKHFAREGDFQDNVL